jgi:methionyl-tRNA synthetase
VAKELAARGFGDRRQLYAAAAARKAAQKTPQNSNEAYGTPYYVTTPIYYISGNPHIGHAYTTVVADVLARTARTFRPTFFLTGTDEHGQKVANAAAAAGKTPQEWCDELVPRWKELFAAYHVSYDDFIRTTEPRHVEKVRRVFERLRAQRRRLSR